MSCSFIANAGLDRPAGDLGAGGWAWFPAFLLLLGTLLNL